ncbi:MULTISPECIES: hypothetical protein [Rhizobium]|uniref:Fermentation-respiration switch protein FrsA (DUF1100 family) n=1 Tax=Rhizobium esperanzae TaxID=1967781 RepID=A0A7W6UTK1_9HYPH|nr:MULTISPECIES: hypothetical protein [Rhizobium]MBB4444103.1 fermentation-respiration switch protein FrsA (DUF1100 family) [Rhizobium esperanzae]MDH6206701.1 fermentation-respiration switch protein FrsA (DUF1100 family) [Rhizobium leguminosarum]
MASIRSIIANNNSTFYDYRTKHRRHIWPRMTLFVLVSPALAFILTKNLTDFINSINTVASILLGFGFSVLFYIASGKDDQIAPDFSLEKKNRLLRVNALSKELFHNVSYFVMTASAGLAFAMIVIAPEAQGEWLSKQALPHLEKITPDAADYLWWVSLTVRSVFFFLIIEAGYTFARVVGRVNFLFEEKLAQGNDKSC